MLYYVVTKCRVSTIRDEAIKLLESRAHREGMWDSRVIACVARKIVDMEEAGLYRNIDGSRRFLHPEFLRPPHQELPSLPDSRRLREVEVVLSGAPMDKIMLFGKRQHDDIHERVLLSQYHIKAGCWKDS